LRHTLRTGVEMLTVTDGDMRTSTILPSDLRPVEAVMSTTTTTTHHCFHAEDKENVFM